MADINTVSSLTYEPISGANFVALRKKIGLQLGWSGYEGGADMLQGYDASFWQSESALNDIRAQRLIDMNNALVLYARSHKGALPNYEKMNLFPDPEKYSFLDMTGDFVKEVGVQAEKINDALNPFSSLGFLSSLKWVVLGGAVIYFLGPTLVKMFVASKDGGASAKP